jgi:hypothetical protein
MGKSGPGRHTTIVDIRWVGDGAGPHSKRHEERRLRQAGACQFTRIRFHTMKTAMGASGGSVKRNQPRRGVRSEEDLPEAVLPNFENMRRRKANSHWCFFGLRRGTGEPWTRFPCNIGSMASNDRNGRMAVSANDCFHQLFVRFHHIGYSGYIRCLPSQRNQIVPVNVLERELARACHELL